MSSTGSTWYFAAGDERVGPRTLDEMRELVADGTLTGETLVWTQGLAAWAPAASFPLLLEPPRVEAEEPAPAPPPLAPRTGGPSAVLAWRRFFARWFDTVSIMMIGLAVAGYTTPENLNSLPLLVLIGAPLAAQLVQALCIAVTGSTPGKALVGLRVATADGRRPTLATALTRELLVWVMGMGMGVSFVLPVTHAYSYYRVTRRGVTPWDERLALRIEVGAIGPVQAVFLGGIMLVATLVVLATVQMAAAG
jgi:uncharacterized RDD family membrane protein YckC